MFLVKLMRFIERIENLYSSIFFIIFELLLRILSLDLIVIPSIGIRGIGSGCVIPFIGPRGVGSECEGNERGEGGKGEGMLLECNGISVTEDTAEIGRSESSCILFTFTCVF